MPTREEIEAQARAGADFRAGIGRWWEGVAGIPQAAKDALGRLVPNPPPVTAPEAAPPPAEIPQVVAPEPAAPPEAGRTPTTLEEFRTQLADAKTALAAAEAVAKDENQPPDVRTRAAATAVTLRGGITTITTQIAAEENRVRDEAAAEKKRVEDAAEKKRLEDKADAKVADSAPKNGDDRWVPIETTDYQGRKVRGVGREVYTNGVWKYQPGSAKADTGFGSGPQGPGTPRSIITDGQGTYWTVDPQTGQSTAISGPKAAAKTITDPDGNVYLQNPDGTPGKRLFDAAAKTVTDNGRIIGYDPAGGKVLFTLDTKTPEGRALADRLERATVENAERAADPKFANASAQYSQEAQRRQALARQELERLTKLQQEGQISPEQAEAQFDAWMKVNVEAPLAGYKRAAEEERRVQEQANLDRQTAERTRVENANRSRDELAYRAGEAGREEAITLGQATRAPEYIADLGGLANSLASGRTDFKFSPGSFDVANFRKAVPNVQELADAAVNRLLARVPRATENPNVSVPLSPPVGDDLRASMNNVRYSGPLSAAPQAEQPLQGLGAVDQGNGMARSVYSNSRWYEWAIPQGPAAAAAPTAPTAPTPDGLPGQLPGETPEQRLARFYAIR
jgi:hypothetical protein